MVTCTLFLASWGHLDFLRSTLTGKMFRTATMMMFDKREGLHDLKDNPRTFPKYFFNLSATVVSKGWLMFYSLIWCDMLWCGIIIVLYSSIENARWSVKVQARVVSGELTDALTALRQFTTCSAGRWCYADMMGKRWWWQWCHWWWWKLSRPPNDNMHIFTAVQNWCKVWLLTFKLDLIKSQGGGEKEHDRRRRM